MVLGSFYTDIVRAIFYGFFMLPVVFLTGSFFHSNFNKDDELLSGNICFAFGLGILGTLVNFLSFFSLYNKMGILCLSSVLVLLRFNFLGMYFKWFLKITYFPFLTIKKSLIFGSIFTWTIIFSFLFALLPEIANDALTYHLNIPKELVWQKSTFPLYFDFNSYTPILMNLLYGIGLIFESVGFAKLFHWFAGYVFILSIYCVCLKESRNELVALWVALLCLLTPTLLNEITSTYVDGAVCLFFFLSFYFLNRGFHGFSKEKNFFFAGLLLGFAVATKIIMLLALPALAICALVLSFYHRPWHLFIKLFLFMGSGFLLAISFWFIRNSILTGNPFFPYLGSLFGTRDFGFVEHFQNMGEPKSWFVYLTLPFHLTFFPEHYDRGYPLGFFLLFALPFCLYGVFKRKEYIYQLIFVTIFTSFWYYFFHNIRFLIPVIFLLTTSSAVGMRLFFEKEREQAGWRTYTITLFFLFLIILMFSYFNYHYRYQYGALFGVFNKQQYLAKLERSQALSIWIDKYLPNDVKILNAEENRGFYIPRTAVREVWFSKRVNYWEGLQRNEIYKILINEGFTHVVRASSEDHHDSETPLRLKLLDGLLNDHHYAKKLINLRSSNQKEKKYEYAIYEIK